MIRVNNVPAHLEARTPDELRLLMQLVNKRAGKSFHFFDFSFVKGKWHCWYEISEQDLQMKVNTNGTKTE